MALEQTIRLGGQPALDGPCTRVSERVNQLLESSVHDHLSGTGEIARLVSSQPGSLKCGQAIQLLESSVGTTLQGTGEIAKLVGVVASLQNDREFVRAAYEADMFRIQEELVQLRAAIALAHINAGSEKLHVGLQKNNVQEDPREAEIMREMYKELERTDIEVHKALRENERLNEEIHICRLAYEQDVSALEGMLQHATQEADRLRETLASEGNTPPKLTPRTFKKVFERSAPALTPRTIIKAFEKSELTPRTIVKTFGGSEPIVYTPRTFGKVLDGTVIPCGEPRDVDEKSPHSPASIRSSSNEPESEHVDETSPTSTPNRALGAC